MTLQNQITEILMQTLQLSPDNAKKMGGETALLGAIPEFDSIAVVSVLTALENQYGFAVEDDEIVADIFESVGTLVAFVKQKLDA